MKNEKEVRELLITNTIRLIAEGGFEKATTNAITHSGDELPGIKMNEVYIYRLFGSKENLYGVAFSRLDQEIVDALREYLGKYEDGLVGDTKRKLRELFAKMWRFVLRNEARCRCYVRYYYSIYFYKNSNEAHDLLFKGTIDEFTKLFKEEADVKSILHSVFTTILDFAVRVYNADLSNSQDSEDHIFNVVYCMMMTYLKDDALKAAPIP